MGTSEFYRVVEGSRRCVDSLVIDTGELDREGQLLMFVVLTPGLTLDDRSAAASRPRSGAGSRPATCPTRSTRSRSCRTP